jgi:biopolymer transport protein ExbD
VPPDQTVLTVLANGTVLLNKQPMSIDEAMEKLGPAYDGRPSKPLFFNAEDKVKYALAMKVLDAAHGVGVNTIGLMTDPPIATSEEAAPPAPPEPPK